MKYQKLNTLVCICLIIGLLPSACAPRDTFILSTCSDLNQSIEQILSSPAAQFPERFYETPLRTDTDFDPAVFFQIFPNLSMKDGYVLDYVYYVAGGGGEPVLYARPIDQEPYLSTDDFLAAEGGEITDYIIYDKQDYLNDVEIVDIPQGYFEFVLFRNYVDQFYLFGLGASDDTRIVCDAKDVKQIITEVNTGDFGYKFTDSQQKQARSMRDIEPRVTIKGNIATVELTSFTIWGGFFRQIYTIDRSYPHTLQFNEINLVPYESGVEI